MMGLAKMKQTTQMEMVYRTSETVTLCGSSPSKTPFMAVMCMINAVNYGPNRKWPWWTMERRNNYSKKASLGHKRRQELLAVSSIRNNRKSLVEKSD